MSRYFVIIGSGSFEDLQDDDRVDVMFTDSRIEPEKKLRILQRHSREELCVVAHEATSDPKYRRKQYVDVFAAYHQHSDWFNVPWGKLRDMVQNSPVELCIKLPERSDLAEVKEKVEEINETFRRLGIQITQLNNILHRTPNDEDD